MGEENSKNRGEFVFETLKREILDLRFKPGQMISEDDICNRFGVSRTPMRDALRPLQEQGFMEAIPYRGTHVTLLSLDNIRQMIYMRVTVEIMVLRDFIQIRIPMVVEDIRYAIVQQKVLTREPGLEPEQFYHMDAQMHSIWFWVVERQKFWEMLQIRQFHYIRFRVLDSITETDLERIIGEHEELFQLISQGNEKGLEESLREHLYYSMKCMCHPIEADYEDYFEEGPEEEWFVM